jgi:hypothetical protein
MLDIASQYDKAESTNFLSVGKNHRSVWYSGLVGYDAIADGIV